jgi:hypothetical protein
MFTELERLTMRYANRDYSKLTETQRKFLLTSSIKDNKDSGGFNTVSIQHIGDETPPLLELFDEYTFIQTSNPKSDLSYFANTRIQKYKSIIGNNRDPQRHDLATATFTCSDGSKIKVRYNTQKV